MPSYSDPEHFARHGHTDGAHRAARVTARDADGRPADAQASNAGNPLAAMHIGAIGLVLGYVAASDAERTTPGRLSALADELTRRGAYRAVLGALGDDLARRIDLLVVADRGQRWAARGRR